MAKVTKSYTNLGFNFYGMATPGSIEIEYDDMSGVVSNTSVSPVSVKLNPGYYGMVHRPFLASYEIVCRNHSNITGSISIDGNNAPLSGAASNVTLSREWGLSSIRIEFSSSDGELWLVSQNYDDPNATEQEFEYALSASNHNPTGTLNVPQPIVGQTIGINWTFSDADGDTVSTKQLRRYVKKPGQFSYSNVVLTSTGGARSYNDTLDSSYAGASVYYVLTFEDNYGGSNTVTSPTYTVISNSAPGTPGAPQLPADIMGGQSISISWTASVDVDGNLSGYKLDRSVDGGNHWDQVYQGAANSCTDTIPTGKQSVAYRVKAYDTYNFESNWATSAVKTVINNRAPNAPASITIPVQISIAAAAAVSWTAATDPEGDTVSYVLERAVGGTNTWTQIYSGANTSYSDDAVSADWVKVRYRVKAVDSRGAASGYVTSPERVIITNNLPTITSSAAAAQGTKDEPFTITYSVNDTDASQTLTVTEKVDGVSRKTFTATRNTSYTFQFQTAQNASYWNNIRNGAHVIRIEVSDGVDTAAKEFTFTKAVTSAVISMTTPRTAADTTRKITACVLSVDGEFPDGALTVEVTNNALDDSPVWEDATEDVVVTQGMTKQIAHTFVNTVHANGYAFNFRVTAEQVGGVGGNITSIQGGFNVET